MKTTIIDINGVKMRLLTYNRSLELCARMNYEKENLDFIDSLPTQSVFYDLGACEGRFAIYAALKGLNVLAFEPEKDNYEALLINIKNNNLEDKINVFNVGVGEIEKDATLNIGQPWAGGHQKIVEHENIRQDLDFDFKAQQKIKIIGLDDFILKMELPKPEFIKIDIDGSEIPFLKGAFNSLKSANKIIFELDKKDENYNYIIQLLNGYGFKILNQFKVPNESFLFNVIFSR